MNTLLRLLNRSVTRETHDGLFARWACSGAAVGVFILAAVFFGRHAHNLAELTVGLVLALLTAGFLVLTGESTTRLHFALVRFKLPVSSRIVEFAGYVLTLSILFFGVGLLSTLSLDRTGMTMGLLAILSASMMPSCLGAGYTLRAVRLGQSSKSWQP